MMSCVCLLQPSLGDSCVSPDINSLPKQTRKHETNPGGSLVDVAAEDDIDFIPGTPPHKKVSTALFLLTGYICKRALLWLSLQK